MSPQTFSEPPSPTNEHDEDADVLDASGVDMAGNLRVKRGLKRVRWWSWWWQRRWRWCACPPNPDSFHT